MAAKVKLSTGRSYQESLWITELTNISEHQRLIHWRTGIQGDYPWSIAELNGYVKINISI